LFGFLFVHISFSQNIRFGFNGGVNLCGLYGPDKPAILDKDYSFKGGLFIDSRIGEYTSSLFELNYNRYHFHFSEPLHSYENSLLTVKESNSFISVPAMIRYKRGYEFIFYYLNAGLQFSALIQEKRETVLYLNNHPVDPNYYYGFHNNPFDIGLIGGIGFQLKPVCVEMRYYFSTNNIYKKEDTREMRYNIISLEASYQLNYVNKYFYGRKTGWKGFKYKITHLFK
jgi:hypothetical protein